MDIHEAIETLKANYPDACYEQLREAVYCHLWEKKNITDDHYCGYAERREDD